jgi:hypothetical protein
MKRRVNKFELIKAMHEIILATTDERLYEIWDRIVPDEADDTDFQDIADDKELFRDTVNCFIRLSKHFKEGLNFEGEWFMGEFRV